MATDTPLQLGIVGLGRMGANIARRLLRDGHRCVGFDREPRARRGARRGAAPRARRRWTSSSRSRAAARGLADAPGRPRSPSSAVEDLAALLEPGDTIVDGGNTHYPDDIRRAGRSSPSGVSTTSTAGRAAACFGLERGFCLMIGGDRGRLRPARADLRVARTRGTLPRRARRAQRRARSRGARLPALRAERARATS